MPGAIVKPDAETVAPSSPVVAPSQENAGGNVVTIQDALSNWDISNDELKKFTDTKGIYSTRLRSLSDVEDIDHFMVATDLVLGSKRYLSPKERIFHSRYNSGDYKQEIAKLLDEYKRRFNYQALLEYAEENADDAFFKKLFEDGRSWTEIDNAKRDIIRKLDDLVRDTYSREGLPRLLAKLRELLAVSKADSKTEDEDPVASVLGRSPFGDINNTIESFIKCIRLFLIYLRNKETYIWKLKLGTEEKSEAQDDEKLSDWTVLDRFLQQDIEKNGPAPEELQLLYKSAAVAVQLEGITPEQLAALEQSDDDAVTETLACIKEAKKYFGIR